VVSEVLDDEEEEDEELMDVYEFLRKMGDKQTGNPALEEKTDMPERSASPLDRKLKYFNLPDEEAILDNFNCVLEKKMLFQGVMMITKHNMCFYSNLLGKKITKMIKMTDIKTLEKQKSLIVGNAIRIITADGKKFTFNWKQNVAARDQAFSLLQRLRFDLGTNSNDLKSSGDTHEEKVSPSSSENNSPRENGSTVEESPKVEKKEEPHQESDVSPMKTEEKPKSEKETTEQDAQSKTLNWSRFDNE